MQKYLLFICLLSVWLGTPQVVQAQDKQITGTVLSAREQQPIIGATVLIKNSTNGTTTDTNGKFSLDAPANSTLVVSFIGYQTKEVPIGNQTQVSITLEENTKNLDEVVVTALGIKREAKSLGYATATVAPEQVTTNRTPNFMNALTGKVAGVNVTTLGSGPAGTSKVRIRGQSSFGGQNNPLIVVNGVPIDNTNFGAATGSQGGDNNNTRTGATRSLTTDGGDGLTSINPDDIETMTVLRGAAASALYGSRAKDGVIMITTKTKGKGSGIGVEYNSNFTTDSPLDYTDFQYEYGQGENGQRPTTARPTSGVWSFGERFQPGMTQVLFDGVEVPYVAQPSHVKTFYRTGHTWTNTVTISSGGEQGGIHLSISNLDNTAIVPNSGYNRRTINLGFTQNLGKKLLVSGNANYSNEHIKNPPQIAEQDMSTPTTIYSLANSMPLWLMREKMADPLNGNEFLYSRFTNRTNPYWATYKRFSNVDRDRIFGNLTARYNFTDWLYLQGRIGQDYYTRDQDYNYPTGTGPIGSAAPAGFVNGEYVQESRRFREINADFLLGADRKFGDFGFRLNLGGNQMYRRSDQNNVLVKNFVVRDLYTVMNGQQKDPIYDISERAVNSLYGMAEVSYKEVLFLNGTLRNDWFSTLSPANRSILYPAVTGSFVFSQAIPSLPAWLSFGKIRAGYAEVGSDTDVAPYSNKLYYRVEAQPFPNQAGVPQTIGIIDGNVIPNASLRPMRVSEWETGLELRFFQNRLGLDVTYYNKLTSDQILRTQVSDASGYERALINVGESRNKGVEMLVNVVPVQTPNFRWEATFNATYNTSEVLKLGNSPADTMITVGTGQFDGELRHRVGYPLGQLFGFGWQRDAQGRQIFGANGMPLRTPLQIQFGSAIPIWVGGITNSFEYKGITLSTLIDFKLGHKMISGTNFNAWRHGLHKGTLAGREQGYVIGNGVNQNGEPNTVKANVQPYYNVVRDLKVQEPFIYNAGFWQLRQVSIGYDFSKLLPANIFLKGLRLSAVGNNVLLLKKWVDNIHPEQYGMASDNLMGLEAPGLPLTRSIGFNLNARF
jgi:TonB-linked SusC/RagA family outer membrane protein